MDIHLNLLRRQSLEIMYLLGTLGEMSHEMRQLYVPCGYRLSVRRQVPAEWKGGMPWLKQQRSLAK